jgi:class 3 adenylate cyclase
VAVLGFGGLVALSVGLVLLLGLKAATSNTRTLLQSRAVGIVDRLEDRLDGTLKPVVSQADWIARHLTDGSVDARDTTTLDTFMRGALAGTPQVAGIGLIDTDLQIRRWGRAVPEVFQDDWSSDENIARWVNEGLERRDHAWSSPLWTPTIDSTVLVHDTPLYRDDRYLGMLAQIVPIAELSRMLANIQAATDMVPFVVYERERVLAHPLLAQLGESAAEPLVHLEELGDPVLSLLLDGGEVPFMLRGTAGVRPSGAAIDGRYRVLLQRDLQRYAEGALTLGVHLDTEGSEGESVRRIGATALTGLGLLLLAILISLLAGRRLSKPIQLLAEAARSVQEGRFTDVPALPRSHIREMDTALTAFQGMVQGLQERQLIRDVLGRFVPESVARTLLSEGGTLPAREGEATVLFCDLQGFTALTERMGPAGIMALLNEYFEAIVDVLERHDGIVTQFQGDAVLAVFNLPTPNPDHAAAALRAALEVQRMAATRRFAGERLICRVGVNSGALVAGAVGARGRLSYTVHGDAVNLAARLEALNKEHGTRVLVSGSTAAHVSGFDLRRVGEVSVRGQTRPVELFELVDGEAGAPS